MGENIIIFSNKTKKVLIFEKIHITESNFGEYRDFHWLKPQYIFFILKIII